MPLRAPAALGGSRRIALKRAGGPRRGVSARAAKTTEKASEGDKPAEKETSALAIADPEINDDNSIDLTDYRSSVEQVKAIAAKISTARRLARKLAEEKAAVSAIRDGDSREAEIIRRKTELNSAEAAAAAARADALARSSKLKVTSSRSREAARLAAENKALLEVLTSVADGNPSIQAKLQAIRQRYPVGSQMPDPLASAEAPTGTVDTSDTPPQPVDISPTNTKPATDESQNGAAAAAVAAPEVEDNPQAPLETSKPEQEAAPDKETKTEEKADKEPSASTESKAGTAAPEKTEASAAEPATEAKPEAPEVSRSKKQAAAVEEQADKQAEVHKKPAAAKSPPKQEAKPAAVKPPVVDTPPVEKEEQKEDEKAEEVKDKPKEQKSPPIVDAFKGVLGGLGSLGAVSGQAKKSQAESKAPPAPTDFPKAPTSAAKKAPETTKAKSEDTAAKEQKDKEAMEAKEAADAEAKRKAAAASKLKAETTAKKLVADKAAAAKAAAKATPEQPTQSPASAAAAAAAEAAAEASAAVPKAAAAAKAAAAKAAEAPPVKPPAVAPEDSKDPTVTAPKQPAGAPNLPVKEQPKNEKTEAKAATPPPAAAAPKQQQKAVEKPPKPQVTAQSSTQDIVSALEATKARLSGRKPMDSKSKSKDDLLPDPEAVERLKAKAEQAAEASYKAKTPTAPTTPPTTKPPAGTAAASPQASSAANPAADPAAATPAKKEPPKEVAPPLSTIIADMKRKGLTVQTDVSARPGTTVRIFVDKSQTVFVNDDNEHHMQLKVGLNNWEDIHVKAISKVTEVPNVTDVYYATMALPQDLFAVDFVVQDFRTTKVDNNEGLDYKLKLVDAPTEEEVLDRRAREFEAAERDRLTQIAQAEAEISKDVAAQREDAEGDAMHEWWRVRRGELRQHAIELVQQEMGGGGDGCADAMEGVYTWLDGRPTPGKQAMLMYNRDASELRHKKELILHLGCNNWAGQKKELYQFTKAIQADLQTAGVNGKGGNWYSTKCMIPSNARIIDFVVSDKDLQVWDNNHHRDYHSRVNNGKDQATLEEEAYRQLLSNSLDSDTEAAQRAAKKAGERVLLRAEAQRKRRALQRKVLYTNPLVPKAGQMCEVYYNPDMTVLSGRPEVYMRGSWNRWTHNQGIPTTKMEPAFTCGIGFMKATVRVPDDALVADFVFLDSDNEQSGFYDNNNGLDYHVPVFGAQGTLPPLRIAHVSVEMAPIAKVGGMGDVVTALGRAVQEYGHEVEVLMPKYDCLRYDLIQNVNEIASFNYNGTHIRVFRGQVEGLNTTFLEPDNGMFWVGCVYGRNDDAHRFNFFCGAALEYLKHHAPAKTDVVHCHDWPTAPVAFGDVGNSRTVFTIHNLNYGADLIGRAMAEASVATTVSPTYAQEISGHPAVAANLGKMFGVRNGIDVDIWDPSTDHFLPVNYNVDNFEEGKAAAKRALRQRMNLSDTDVPVVGVVTRLTHQKGIHLIKHAAYRTLERGGQFVLLGSAPDPRVQADFESLAGDLQNQYNDRARLVFSFDEPLSHMIYAGCDLILVPSMFEPCGLTQMIGMRYGTVAVVRKTGGLADTVFDVDDDEDRADAYGMEVNGFNFEGTDNGGLDYALNRSINMWYSDRAYFTEIAKRCMTLDWSWYGPAQDYVELYYRALKAM